MAQFDTVLFDLDGTLLNTLRDIADSLNYALARNGQPVRSREEVRAFIGRGIRMLVAQALPQGERDPRYEAIMADYRAHYAVHGCDQITVYPGIKPLLHKLRERGTALAVVTNKPHSDALPMIGKYFGALLPLTVGKKPEAAAKPAPDSVLAAMKILGADPARTLYVGDTEVDLQTAQNAGIPCVLVSWGYRDRAQLETLGALAVIDAPEELYPFVEPSARRRG